MVAMVQRLDARGFFFRPQLSVCKVSALVLEVFRNRFSCHGCSVAELSSSELSNFGHSLTIHGPPRGDWTETYYRQPSTLEIPAGEGPCLDTALLGVSFIHGQEGDQFPKTDRAFCHLDVRRMPAAAGFSRSLRLEGFLRQRIHAITLLSCRSILDQRGRIRAAVRRWNRTNVNSRKSRVVGLGSVSHSYPQRGRQRLRHSLFSPRGIGGFFHRVDFFRSPFSR